jgi:hypothetical protein
MEGTTTKAETNWGFWIIVILLAAITVGTWIGAFRK